MIKMRYDASGTAVSDFEVHTVVNALIKDNPKGEVVYSTENVFWQMYLAAMMGYIKLNQIVFLYNEHKIRLTNNKLDREKFPDGFLSLGGRQKSGLVQYLV